MSNATKVTCEGTHNGAVCRKTARRQIMLIGMSAHYYCAAHAPEYAELTGRAHEPIDHDFRRGQERSERNVAYDSIV